MDIPIDEQAVRDELRSIEGEFIAAGEQPHVGPQAAPEPQPPPMDWSIPAGLMVMLLDRLVCPNWKLEPTEKEMIHAQTVQTLAVFFPTLNIDPRWLALASLGGTFAAIAGRRVNLDTGEMTPMRAPPPKDDDEADEQRAAA